MQALQGQCKQVLHQTSWNHIVFDVLKYLVNRISNYGHLIRCDFLARQRLLKELSEVSVNIYVVLKYGLVI